MSQNLELLPEYYARSSWWEHVPVAHWLIENIKPAKIVELGTHYGVSFFSFCEAAKKYSQGTFLYAVDTWYGDTQAGEYGNEVYESVAEHHERHHRARSRLIRSTFDEAANHFENSSIDLIHIDGFHTYEAVRNDFEKWEKKLKEGGTFLFHDWNVRKKILVCGNYGKKSKEGKTTS